MTPYWIHLRRGRRRRGLPLPGGVIDDADDLRSRRGDGYAGRDGETTLIVVGEVQGLLRKQWGAKQVETDGLFGPQTEAAVAAFQKANGLPSTGIVDAATSNALQDSDSVPIGSSRQRSAPAAKKSSSKTWLVVAAVVAGGALVVGGGAAAHAHKKARAA